MAYVHGREPLIVRAYAKVFRHAAATEDLWIQGRDGPLRMRIVAPVDLPSAPTIVLVHGFAPNGVRDYLLNAFAQRLAHSGLRVAMPEIPSEMRLQMDPSAVTNVDDAIRWGAAASGQKVSVFGISFSGGLVISAAANPQFAGYVKTVFCVSGYNSVARVGRFYLREDVRGPDGRPYAEKPAPGDLALIALQYIDELAPSEDKEPLSAALRRVAAERGIADASATAALNRQQRALLDDLLNARTPAMRELYLSVMARHRPEWDAISPMGKIGNLRASLFVLHGVADGRIPTEEAEWTKAEAGDRKTVSVVISPWLNHAILVLHTPLREKLRVLYLVSEMLNDALRPVPLGKP